MKIIKLKENLTVVMDSGDVYTNTSCDDNLFNKIVENQDDEQKVISLISPELHRIKKEVIQKEELLEGISKSSHLTLKGQSIYLEDISELSLPEDLAIAIYNAEISGDKDLLQSYKNFWTLACLNPDGRARTNLFWFLNKYGLTVTKSGLFLAFRNVKKLFSDEKDTGKINFITSQYLKIKKQKKSPKNFFIFKVDEEYYCNVNKDKFEAKCLLGTLQNLYDGLSEEKGLVYTDQYTNSFRIRIGKVVSMPREKCDSIQENTCSRGLHVASFDWLKENNGFGNQTLAVLVNPADVVAVPPRDSYGKMRVCAYLPVSIIDLDTYKEDSLITNGFEDDFIDKICYNGTVSSENAEKYEITIPNILGVNKDIITDKLQEIKTFLAKKYEN